MSPSNTLIIERFRSKPILFLLGFTVTFFYATPLNYQRFLYTAVPVICQNEGCQAGIEKEAMSLWTEENHPNYLVFNPGCKIIDMDPFDKSVNKFWKRGKPTKCAKGFSKLENQTLTMDKNVTNTWKLENLKCCYRSINRVTQSPDKYNKDADYVIKYSSECYDIPLNDIGTIVNDTFIKVECKGDGEAKANVEFKGSPLPPNIMSNATKKKAEYWDDRKAKGLNHDPPSILVIGVDSISRLHMMRSLPKTRAYLEKNDFIELKGYNKVGPNTFPNIMAGFGGMEQDNYSSCWQNKSVKLDDCPYLWKNFSDLNYMTAFLEDAPGIAIFNYVKIGFVLPPADYYMRPLMVATAKDKGWSRGGRRSSCVGGLSPTDFQANYIKEFMVNMGKDYPYFLFSWFTSVGHNDFNGLKTADDTFLKLFEVAMNNSSANPDSTVMIFMSDHGYREGSFRETFLGFYEESLPFFYFRIPTSLKERYPEWHLNLQRNSGQLTSPLDLHTTLKEILYEAKSQIKASDTTDLSSLLIRNVSMAAPTPKFQQSQRSSPFLSRVYSFLGFAATKGQQTNAQVHQVMTPMNSSPSHYYADNITKSEPLNPQYRQRYSFFEYIPDNRTCESASIPQRYCMCGVSPVMSKSSSLSSRMGDIVVNHVNHLLEDVIKPEECVALKFKKFLYGREVGHGDVWDNFNRFINYKDYMVGLEVDPSEAHFESKIRIFDNSTESIIGDVSRINNYNNQSYCVSDFTLKPLCYCETFAKEKMEKAKKKKGKKGKNKKSKDQKH